MFCRNNAFDMTDAEGLDPAKAYYFNNAGIEKELRPTTSADDIRVDYDADRRWGKAGVYYRGHNLATETRGGTTTTNLCAISVLFKIQLAIDFHRVSDEGDVGGAIDLVRYHYVPGAGTAGGSYRNDARVNRWDAGLRRVADVPPSKGAIIAHERGHMDVFISEVDALLTALTAMEGTVRTDFSDAGVRDDVSDKIAEWLTEPVRSKRHLERATTREQEYYRTHGWFRWEPGRPPGVPSGVWDDAWQKR